MSTDRHPSN